MSVVFFRFFAAICGLHRKASNAMKILNLEDQTKNRVMNFISLADISTISAKEKDFEQKQALP